MRLTLVISSMSTGGAERTMACLANAWAGKGWPVTLLTLDSGPSFYQLDPRVTHRPLAVSGSSPGVWAAIGKNLLLLKVLGKAFSAERPAAVISFMDATN